MMIKKKMMLIMMINPSAFCQSSSEYQLVLNTRSLIIGIKNKIISVISTTTILVILIMMINSRVIIVVLIAHANHQSSS